MRRIALFLASLALLFPMACSNAQSLPDGLYAKFDTDKGSIIIKLEPDKAPLTVINFVGLAEGTLDATQGKPFYDGLVFHRVIADFMIQGGDPLATGAGGPGYEFPDEITDLKLDRPGTLAMANSGKNTNGSQFFITHKATPWLDGKHTVFGYVVSGQEVVNAMQITQDKQGNPVDAKPDVIRKVTILRYGAKAKAFKTDQKAFDAVYGKLMAALAEASKNLVSAQIGKIDARWPGLAEGSQGLRFLVLKKGTGAKPAAGATVSTLYKGMFADGKVFDESALHGNVPLSFRVANDEMIPGYDKAVQDMQLGEKRLVVIPPELAYGASGTPDGYIQPYSYLIFEIELTGIK